VPTFRPGDEAFCELRGQVVVSRAVHEAPIGIWPKGRRRGERGAAIILAGDLVQAVRNGAAVTVRYWWGVGTDRVWIGSCEIYPQRKPRRGRDARLLLSIRGGVTSE
jgi:hypothetical protein